MRSGIQYREIIRMDDQTIDEQLYQQWDKHWVEDEKMTFVGKILCPIRIDKMKKAIEQLEITTALDAGCGVGHLLQVFSDLGIKDYIGLDVSARAAKICQHKGLNVKMGRLENEEKKYDLVAAEGMLEHFINFEPFVQHMARVSNRYILLS